MSKLHRPRKALPRGDKRAAPRVNPTRKALPKRKSNAASNKLHYGRKALPKGRKQTGVKAFHDRYGKHERKLERKLMNKTGRLQQGDRRPKYARSEMRSPPGHSSGRVARQGRAAGERNRRDRMYQMMRAQA